MNEQSGIPHAKILPSSLSGSYAFLSLSFPFCCRFPHVTNSVLLFLLIILPLTRRNCMWSAYFKVPDYTSILKSNTFVLWIMQIIYANMGLEKSKWAHPALPRAGRGVDYGRLSLSLTFRYVSTINRWKPILSLYFFTATMFYFVIEEAKTFSQSR